ncbi:hypothetical protein Btru_047845 [Bulinus truncatus]|nr:hypothetical protein Btru_047845 [Bulinus truncatus]
MKDDIVPGPSQGCGKHEAAGHDNQGFTEEPSGRDQNFGSGSSCGAQGFDTQADCSEETVPKTVIGCGALEAKWTPASAQESDNTTSQRPHGKSWNVFHANPGDDLTSYSETQTAEGAHKLLKLLFMIFSFTLVLASAVLCRLSLLTLTLYLRPKSSSLAHNSSSSFHSVPSLKTAPTDRTDVEWIWAAILIVVAPYVFTMCSSLWKLAFKSTSKLCLSTLFVAFLQESVHSFGLCTLVFYVLPRYDPFLGSLLLSSTVAMPALVKMVAPHNDRSPSGRLVEDNGNNPPRTKDEDNRGKSWRVSFTNSLYRVAVKYR